MQKKVRNFSVFQSKGWMRAIGKKRKYKNNAKGEKHPKAKMSEYGVKLLRALPLLTREASERIATLWNVNPNYLYQIRARKRWKHI